MPATSQLDKLISITAISVLSFFRTIRDWFRSFGFCIGASIGHISDDGCNFLEALLVPARNRRSKVGRITGETGKSAEDERVAAGSVVAMKRSNVRGAKGPCHLQCLQHRGRQGRDDKGVH